MKLFSLSVAISFSPVINSLTLGDLAKIAENQLQITLDQQTSNNGNEREPGLRAITQTQMALVNDYGCWCYFEANHGAGKGKPSDALDALCKKLHDGYECIIHDQNANSTPCTPWEIPYTSAFGGGIPGGLTKDQIISVCNIQNGGSTSCAAQSCIVESFFIQEYFAYALTGGIIDQAKSHDNGFDVKTGCPISRGVKSEKSCCGAYPDRYPFKTYDGGRDCCVGSTFNANIFSCCSDGTIKISC